ncbi:MFS transporter [Sphingomonas paeninsulae]|nr:MFS transporter [Sphingomonas paeninsulae]
MKPQTAAAASRGVAWRAVAVLLLFYALAMVDRQVLFLLVGPIRKDLGATDFQVGLLQGLSFAVSFCLFGLPFGYAVDRVSRRLVVFVGVMVWAAATTASGFASSYGELFAARILVGAGEAALGPAAFSMLSDLFPPKKLTFALSIYSMGSLVGNALAFALSGWVIGLTQAAETALFGLRSWQAVFLIVGTPGLLIAFCIFLVPEPTRRGHRGIQASWPDLFAFIRLRRRFFICHLGGFSCMMTIAYANLAWGPTFLVRHFGWSIPQVGATLSVYSLLLGIFCFLFSGKMVEWLQNRGYEDAHLRYYAVGSLITTLAGASAFQAPNAVIYLCIAAFGALFVNLAAIAPAALQIVTPGELRGRVSAIYLLVTGLIGMTAGPALVSGITQFIFADDNRVNDSLSITYLIVGPLACVFFAFGLRPMREARALRMADDVA